MKFLADGICRQGGRECNQDYAAGSVEGGEACLAVCDGLGSYAGSGVASRLCATKIVEAFLECRRRDGARAFEPDSVLSYVRAAHEYVAACKEESPRLKSGCTTVACAVTDGKTTVFATIGDTRVYFFRNKKLCFQSKDHSLSQIAADMGEISVRDIRTHKDQNKLTRVLGSDYYTEPDCEVERAPIAAGDCFLLCTDGFWEYVYEEEMESDLSESATPGEALNKMEKRLEARVKRFNDNYSAILVMAAD